MATITLKAARSAHPLASAVLRQLGGGKDAIGSAIDAARHGANAGFPGFVFYSATIAFAKRHRAAIRQLAENMSQDLGESMIGMIQGFNCFKGNSPTECEVIDALNGRRSDGADMVLNALAWFALEEVGRALEALSE